MRSADPLAAVARLRRVRDALAAGAELPVEDRKWFVQALDGYFTGASDGLRLDDALGLACPPGSRRWWTAERRDRRDALIRRLAAGHTGSRSARAAAVAEQLRRYAATGWPRDRRAGQPFPDSAQRRLLFDIFKLDDAPPTSLRQLHDILSAK